MLVFINEHEVKIVFTFNYAFEHHDQINQSRLLVGNKFIYALSY
jgi:hypothetical protein